MQNKTSKYNVFLCESIFYPHKRRHCFLKRWAKVLIFRKYKTMALFFFEKKLNSLLNYKSLAFCKLIIENFCRIDASFFP